MHDLLNVKTAVYPSVGAAVTTDIVDFAGSTGVCAVMNFGVPIEVLRMGITVDSNEALAVGTSFSIKLWKYLTPGSSTNAVSLGTISLGAVTVAADGIVYNNLDLEIAAASGDDGVSVVHVAPRDEQSNKWIVLPGQQLVWDVTNVSDTTGKGQVWVQYVERPFTGNDLAAVTSTEVTS